MSFIVRGALKPLVKMQVSVFQIYLVITFSKRFVEKKNVKTNMYFSTDKAKLSKVVQIEKLQKACYFEKHNMVSFF